MSSTRPVLSSTGSFAVFSWPAHASQPSAACFQSSAARGVFRLDAQQEAKQQDDKPAAAKGGASAAAHSAPAANGAVADAAPAFGELPLQSQCATFGRRRTRQELIEIVWLGLRCVCMGTFV
jgi:hypothetical protein